MKTVVTGCSRRVAGPVAIGSPHHFKDLTPHIVACVRIRIHIECRIQPYRAGVAELDGVGIQIDGLRYARVKGIGPPAEGVNIIPAASVKQSVPAFSLIVDLDPVYVGGSSCSREPQGDARNTLSAQFAARKPQHRHACIGCTLGYGGGSYGYVFLYTQAALYEYGVVCGGRDGRGGDIPLLCVLYGYVGIGLNVTEGDVSRRVLDLKADGLKELCIGCNVDCHEVGGTGGCHRKV